VAKGDAHEQLLNPWLPVPVRGTFKPAAPLCLASDDSFRKQQECEWWGKNAYTCWSFFVSRLVYLARWGTIEPTSEQMHLAEGDDDTDPSVWQFIYDFRKLDAAFFESPWSLDLFKQLLVVYDSAGKAADALSQSEGDGGNEEEIDFTGQLAQLSWVGNSVRSKADLFRNVVQPAIVRNTGLIVFYLGGLVEYSIASWLQFAIADFGHGDAEVNATLRGQPIKCNNVAMCYAFIRTLLGTHIPYAARIARASTYGDTQPEGLDESNEPADQTSIIDWVGGALEATACLKHCMTDEIGGTYKELRSNVPFYFLLMWRAVKPMFVKHVHMLEKAAEDNKELVSDIKATFEGAIERDYEEPFELSSSLFFLKMKTAEIATNYELRVQEQLFVALTYEIEAITSNAKREIKNPNNIRKKLQEQLDCQCANLDRADYFIRPSPDSAWEDGDKEDGK